MNRIELSFLSVEEVIELNKAISESDNPEETRAVVLNVLKIFGDDMDTIDSGNGHESKVRLAKLSRNNAVRTARVTIRSTMPRILVVRGIEKYLADFLSDWEHQL